MRLVFAGMFLLMSGSTAVSEEVGRAQFNGRTIVLNSDQTSEYAEKLNPSDTECRAIASNVVPVEYCLDEKAWQPEDLGINFENAYSSRSNLYIGMISEEEFIDGQARKAAVAENAREGAGPKGLQDLKQEFRTINGEDWLHSTFSIELDGFEIDMENFMFSREGDGTVQITIWGGARSMRKARPEVDRIVATFRVVN